MHKTQFVFSLLLIFFVFLRLYELPQRAIVGWDQADSAWAAKIILTDNPIKLDGVPIKGNTSMTMGPLYYYMIAPFYFLTDLDMLASPLFAGFVSIISFIVFYVITKKIFDTPTALIAAFFYTFSTAVMSADRVQAAFILIPIVSYAVFYFLYKAVSENTKYLLSLAAVIGFGFHVHFTTIFYFPLIVLMLPFFPRNKKTVHHVLLAIPVFILFVSPMLYSMMMKDSSGSGGIIQYLNASFHGFHLRRVLQLAHDGFIIFEGVLQFKVLRPVVFVVLPAFIAVYYISGKTKHLKDRLLLPYMITLWILIPWLGLATYNGELTDYYFSLPRNIGFAILAFLAIYVYRQKIFVAKVSIVSFLLVYAIYGLDAFSKVPDGNYQKIKDEVISGIKTKRKFEFRDRDPVFYTYYIYTHYNKK